MIDPTTLPQTVGSVEIPAGRRFEIRGSHFDMWPSELVLSYSSSSALNETLPSFTLMRVVEKTDNKLVVETTAAHTFQNPITWSHFATPYNGQRSLLEYSADLA